MNTLKIRDLVVGEGAPKIIVPIVGKIETSCESCSAH